MMPIEVVSKPQIRLNGPACQRDFASDSKDNPCSTSVRPIEKVVVPSIRKVCEHLSEVCNAVPLLAGASDGVLKPLLETWVWR